MKGPSVASGRVAFLLSKGPSVGHRTIYRSEGALRLSGGGGSVGQRGPSVCQRGAICRSEGPSVYQGSSIGQISLRRSKNVFLVRGAIRRLTLEGLSLAIGLSVGQRVLHLSEGALCQSKGALRLPDGPSVGKTSPPSVKKYWSEGPSIV